MTGFGSGLDSQFGIGEEGTVGTIDTVDHFYELTSSSLLLTPTFIESDGIRAGDKFKRSSQVGISKVTTGGDVMIPYTNKKMGQLWRLALGAPLVLGSSDTGATPVQVGTSAAYEQVLQPGPMLGLSSTIELGKSEPASGNIFPFTYNGCKVTDWELAITDGAEVTFKLTFDGWQETVGSAGACTAASFTSGQRLWTFADVTNFKLGGTASTTSSKVSISSGSSVSAIVTSLTLTGTNHFANERYGLGNAGVKAEQIENDFCEIMVSFESELAISELYTPFTAGTITAMQFNLTGPANGIDTGHAFSHQFVMPAIEFQEASSEISGPDLISLKGSAKIYDDGTNAPFQVYIMSGDTTL